LEIKLSTELIFQVHDRRSYGVISFRLGLRLAAVAVEGLHCVGYGSVCCSFL